MKKCPFCAEDIQDAAIVCKQCGRDLEAPPASSQVASSANPPQSAPQQVTAPVRKRRKTSIAALGCLGAVLGLLLLIGLASLVEDGERPPRSKSVKQTVLYSQQDGVPVHAAPEGTSAVVGTLPFAAKVAAIGSQGEWTELAGTTAKWVRTDLLGPERPLSAEERQQRTAELLAELRTIPASEARKNRDLYEELTRLQPDEPVYQQKHEHYADKLREQEAAVRKEQEQRRAEQRARIARFGEAPKPSAWDGSYLSVKRYLERVANDPDSIEIDACTKVFYTDQGWLVGCDYRGRNAFGGMIRQSNWFTIVNDTVVQIHEASAYSP